MPAMTRGAIRGLSLALAMGLRTAAFGQEGVEVRETPELLTIETPELSASVAKTGYVTGIKAQSFLDKKTGVRDLGFGLDIADWIMEPGSDEAYRDKLEPELVYQFGNAYHGKTAKRSIEGPQICTQAKTMDPHLVRGKDFVAVRQQFTYRTAAPGKKTGSKWTQWIVFPKGKRYFVSMDRIDAVNDSEGMFLRLDMPGHIKHKNGDTFSEVYLSYHGKIESKEFATDEKCSRIYDSTSGPRSAPYGGFPITASKPPAFMISANCTSQSPALTRTSSAGSREKSEAMSELKHLMFLSSGGSSG